MTVRYYMLLSPTQVPQKLQWLLTPFTASTYQLILKVLNHHDTEMAQIKNPIPVDPILIFPYTFPSRNPMRFVGLDSKLYFLGGEFHSRSNMDKNGDPTYPFSAKVYVFDLAEARYRGQTLDASDASVLPEVTSMGTGKPNLQAFVFDRKIYALGSADRYTTEPGRYNYFEVYDPNTKKWSTLPSPPWERGLLLVRHIVLHRKLYAFVSMTRHSFGFSRRDPLRIFVFDLVKEEWITSFDYLEHYNFVENGKPYCYALVDDTIYECPSSGGATNFIDARGPLPCEEQSSDMNDETFLYTYLFSKRVRLSPDLGFDFYKHHTPAWDASASLLQFDNNLICNVLSGYLGSTLHGDYVGDGVASDDDYLYNDDFYDDDDLYIIWDNKIRYFSINVVKPHVAQTYSRADWALPAVKAKCIHSSHFISRTPWSTAGYFAGTYLLSDQGGGVTRPGKSLPDAGVWQDGGVPGPDAGRVGLETLADKCKRF